MVPDHHWALDSSEWTGTQYNATIGASAAVATGTIGQVSGYYNEAASFPGVSSNYLSATGVFTSGQTSVTASAWIKLDATWSANGIVVSFGRAYSSGSALNLGAYLYVHANRRLVLVTVLNTAEVTTSDLGFVDNGFSATCVAPIGAIPIDTWTHVAFTISTTTGSTSSVFVNGVKVDFVSSVQPMEPPSTTLSIGWYPFDGGLYPFKGLIDEVKIWHSALTDIEIAELYSSEAFSWQTQSSVMTIDETSIYSDVLTPAEVANLYHSHLTSGSGSQLLEDTSNDTHGLSYSFDFVSGTDYTLTISAKALTRDYIHLSLPSGAFGTEQRAAFNLSAGTSASESGSPTIAMTSTGDGWYRCSISATATATATASFNYYASDGTLTYTGNGYYGISVNFAQLEESGSFTTYEKDGLSQETQVETIGAVPGTGQLLGIHYYNDTVYVFRNAADNATAVMWASSANGWTSKKTGLTPNGKYRCVNYAFGATQKMYIVSGVHKAAEWDGTTWTDITTGMSPDTPEHVIGHKKHLFLAFGNSVQHSPLGDPTGTWSVLTGASEMVLPYQVTGFSTLSNGSLGIFSREGIIQLAGTSSADWVANNMTEYSNNAGAKPDTIQSMGNKMFFLDSRGITELGASDTSSDFYDALISHAVDNRFRDKWANAICSCVVREKGQYRLFFSDGSGLIMTVVNNQIMFTEMELPHRIQCIVSSEDSEGDEVIYFGSDDGYVRQMEKGKHFDIQNINCSVQTAPFNCGHKGFVKRFRRLKFDTSTVGTSSLSVTPIFSLENTGAPVKSTPEIIGTGSLLGTSLLGISLLGAGLVREGDIDLEDHAEWIRLLFTSSDNDQFPWEIDGYTVDYFLGRKRR